MFYLFTFGFTTIKILLPFRLNNPSHLLTTIRLINSKGLISATGTISTGKLEFYFNVPAGKQENTELGLDVKKCWCVNNYQKI